ncbi:CDP-diacylglycerol-serine O-phosphatidyltransferase [Aspergillus affinis]|uniref:CDP-diacylglycerol-serine O-phosphatidyltransferase n=1 Tax=Aspergillus affinis TaxID=1070780 RepID=UPI0022FF3417|nr:CDP-diacylglycerol-serine O-phosphatidyltransferase [Aspergillus affinis]KAI9041399.1 CDP-diacylglycerol-serine O-phosphatidyltransferase [Aspergillus affinis]
MKIDLLSPLFRLSIKMSVPAPMRYNLEYWTNAGDLQDARSGTNPAADGQAKDIRTSVDPLDLSGSYLNQKMAVAKEVKFDMLRRLRVADYVTLSNALCGVLAIFASTHQLFITAHILIFLGYEFDRFDGMIARWRNETSEMGKQLDSFSDLVSFVLAPAFMLYSLGLRTPADQAILTFFVLCGVARLARFNVVSHLTPKDAQGKSLYHEGLPTAYAALIMSTAVAVAQWLSWTEEVILSVYFPGMWGEVHTATVLVAVLGAGMISKRFKLKLDGGLSIPAATVVLFGACWMKKLVIVQSGRRAMGLFRVNRMDVRNSQSLRAVRLTSPSDLNKIQHLDVTLQTGRENLIVIYGGSFNPPHKGHLDVLLSGLRPELGAAAMLVLPSEDFHLCHKLASSQSNFFLSRTRRADLLDAIPDIPKNRVWVWSSTWYPLKPFMETVVRLTQADGFEVAFTHLVGPDNLNLENPLDNYPYELPRMLVSNKARHVAEHSGSDGRPAAWKGFEEWSRSDDGDNGENGDREAVLWTCIGVDERNLKRKGYYLQFARPHSTDINSTDLRRDLVQAYRLDEESLNRLSTEALVKLLERHGQ